MNETKKDLITRHALNLKSYIGTGLALDECKAIINTVVEDGLTISTPAMEFTCKGIKREGEGCTLNNNCRYPECQHLIWSDELPTEPGKYVVQTKSKTLKKIKTMDAYLSYPKPNKPHWSFTNQDFYRYLKRTLT